MKFRILCCLIFFGRIGFAQQVKVIDSLRKIFQTEKDQIKKADIYYDLSKEMEEVDVETLIPYADTLETISKNANYLKGQGRAINLRAWYFHQKGEYEKAIPLLRQDLAIRTQISDSTGIARVFNDIGSNYKELYKPDSAIYYFQLALDINEHLGEYKNVAAAYANIGNLFSDQKLHDKAIEYLKKGLQTRLQHGDEKGAMYTYNNLAVAFGVNDQLDSAMLYSNKGIDIALKYENLFVAGVIIGGICHLLNEKGKYKEAIPYGEKSIEYLTKANRKANLVFPYINIATAYNRLGQPQKALQYAMPGYLIMQQQHLFSPLEVYYEEIAKSHELLGNDKESLIWFKKFMQLDDSLFKSENTKNLADAEAKYQNQKKETEISQQQFQLSEQSRRLFKEKTWNLGLIGVLVALGLFGTLYFHRYKLRKKVELDAAVIKEQHQGLEAVIAAQEEERKRIAKDLHDGVAQELVALKLGFQVLEQKLKGQLPDQADKLRILSNQLDQTTKEVRDISHLMLPPALEQQGLASSLEYLLANTLKNAGVDYKLDIEGLTQPLEEKIKIGVYRIAQELINNIIKHAGAGSVVFYLSVAGSGLVMKVEDDGQGFNFEEAKTKGSMGLLNIVSRVATLGGNYKFENRIPHGTHSEIYIPISGSR